MSIDHKDKRILVELLLDSSRSQKAMGSHLNMGDSDFTKHKTYLLSNKIIKRYTIDVDYRALGFHTSGFFFFTELDKSDEASGRITKKIADIPEIVEANRVFGRDDFIVKIVCRSTEEFYRIISELRSDPAIDSAHSHSIIVAVPIKDERGAPILSGSFLEIDQ